MPDLLHNSEGLRIVRNELNGFVVATLHYRADPAKRSEAWRLESAQGMTAEQHRQEYEIDYSAVLGAKVFPEIMAHRTSIVCAPFDIPEGVRLWGGFDYGLRNPASFHCYAVLDDITYSVWELYEPCKNVADFAEKMRSCPYWDRIRYIAADPSIWAPTQQQQFGEPISIFDQFWREGVRKFMKGRADAAAEQAWIALLRKAWSDPEAITFRIFDTCHEQIHEFETAVYTPQSERQLINSVYHETINDKNNHSLDDNKYFMLSRPAARSSQQQSSWDYAKMVGRWAQKKPRSAAPRTQPVKGYI